MDRSQQAQHLKSDFIATHGHWNQAWDQLLQLDPGFFAIFARFSGLPWRNGPLDPKVKDLIAIAINVQMTQLHAEAVAIHIAAALRHGASRDEILEVIIMVAAIGIHAVTFGVPILVDELAKAGRSGDIPRTYSPRQEDLKQTFQAVRGYWRPLWDDLLALDADFFESFLDLSGAPARRGRLEPKVRELIYIAIDASASHMYETGLRIHIQQSLGYGASVAEIMEVLQLTSVLGMHSCSLGVPALLGQLAAQEGTAG
jgi:alkylhydroperoxidase/carboxymuconolactone decarboxylase family protein YurZ